MSLLATLLVAIVASAAGIFSGCNQVVVNWVAQCVLPLLAVVITGVAPASGPPAEPPRMAIAFATACVVLYVLVAVGFLVSAIGMAGRSDVGGCDPSGNAAIHQLTNGGTWLFLMQPFAIGTLSWMFKREGARVAT